MQYILDQNKHNHNSKGAPATGGQLYIHDFLDYDSIVQVHEWYNYSKQLNFVASLATPQIHSEHKHYKIIECQHKKRLLSQMDNLLTSSSSLYVYSSVCSIILLQNYFDSS